MSMLKNTVLLLKSQICSNEIDKYEELLRSNNFKVIQVKTLIFKYHNLDVLAAKLKNSDDYSGIILSSPRCVEAVYQSINSKLDNSWQAKNNYTVGEATYKSAKVNLGIECKGKETGNSQMLSQFILKDKPMAKSTLLFPHGNLKTDTLKLELGKEGIKLEDVYVYDTIANPNIEDDISKITHSYSKIPEFIVFFSPSGINASIEFLKRVPVDFNTLKLVAIGPVTKTAMKEKGLTVYNVAENPTPKDVLNALSC